MDKESQALDDSLKNDNVGGQNIDIQEDSLSYEASGEKDFGDAADTKRKAQEEIKKVIPGYRAQEKKVLAQAHGEIPTIVKSGLGSAHQLRAGKFDDVLVTQEGHKKEIETDKGKIFTQFQDIYKEAKRLVDRELATISDVETDFET